MRRPPSISRTPQQQTARTARVLIAVAVCLIVTDVVTLIHAPFLNVLALVGLLTSLFLLGASIRLLRSSSLREEK